MGEQAAIDSISLPDAASLAQTTRITGVLREPPLVPRDEEYQSRKRSIDPLQKRGELTATSDKNQAPMMSHSGSTIIQAEQAQREEPEDSLCDEQGLKDADYHNIDDENSATIALSNAVRIRKNLRIIRLLLAKGANPASCIVQPSYANRSALHAAAEVGYASAINTTTEIESIAAELTFPDSYGDTALPWAASNGHEAALDMLLEKGANPNTTNKISRTPLILAVFFGNKVGVRLLLAKGAKIDITDKATETALICAARKGHTVVVGLLLANEAKQDIRNKDGETALSLANKNGHFSVVSLLRAQAAG